jgi:hypothetical protein
MELAALFAAWSSVLFGASSIFELDMELAALLGLELEMEPAFVGRSPRTVELQVVRIPGGLSIAMVPLFWAILLRRQQASARTKVSKARPQRHGFQRD